MLDQLDEEFGIGNLVKEEIHTARNTAYTERDLKGLKVEHNLVSIIIYSFIICNNFHKSCKLKFEFLSSLF